MSKTLFTPGPVSLELYRYPQVERDPLQAWSAADEYLLQELQLEHLDDSRPVLVLNDAFGALALSMLKQTQAPVVSVNDSWLSQRGAAENLVVNQLDEERLQLLDCLAEMPLAPQLVLIRVPKTLALLEHQLCQLRPVLQDDTRIMGAGMVRDIHTSTLKLFERYVGSTRTSLARKKARLVFAEYDANLEQSNNPYPTVWPLEDTPYQMSNHANVFSRASLDLGARVLMRYLPTDLDDQQVIDLGCGNGVLSLMLLHHNPACRVTLVDESLMAVASARDNIETNLPGRAGQCRFVADNCLDSQPDQSADLVLCNPPFHQQQTVTRHIAEQMVRDAWRCLRPGGRLLLIGNRHLGYHVQLKRQFGNCDQAGGDAKFVVLEAKKDK